MQRTVAGGHTGAPRGCLRDVPVRNNKRVNRLLFCPLSWLCRPVLPVLRTARPGRAVNYLGDGATDVPSV